MKLFADNPRKAGYRNRMYFTVCLALLLLSTGIIAGNTKDRSDLFSDTAGLTKMPYRQASPVFKSIIEKAEKSGSRNDYLFAIKIFADYLFTKEHYHESTDYYKRILTEYPAGSKKYFKILYNLCTDYAYLTERDSLFYYANKGVWLASEKKDEKQLQKFLGMVGYYYEIQNEWPSALTYYQRALAIAEKLNDKNETGFLLLDIGRIYDYSKDTVRALEYYKKAYNFGKKFHLEDIVKTAKANTFSLSAKDTPAALKKEIEFLMSDTTEESKWNLIVTYNNLAVAYGDLGKHDKEKYYYYLAKTLADKYDFSQMKSLVYYNLADFYYDSGTYYNPDSVLWFLNEGIKFAKKLETPSEILDYLEYYQDVYENSNDYKNALNYLMKAEHLKDSIKLKEKLTQLNELRAFYRTKQAEKNLLLEKLKIKRSKLFGITVLLLLFFIISFLLMTLYFRKRKSDEIKLGQKFTDRLLENNPHYIVILNDNYQYVYRSPSFMKDFAFQKNEKIREIFLDKIFIDDLDDVLQRIEDVRKGVLFKAVFRCRMLAKDGTYKYVSGTLANKLNEPQLKGVLMTFYDVTDQIDLERKIKESEYKYRMIYESFPDVYFRINQKGKILDINSATEKILGYTPEELAGNFISDHLAHKEDWIDLRKKVIAKGELKDENLKLYKKNGDIITTSVSGSLLLNDEGEIVGFQGTIRDITSREEAEQAIRRANETKDKLFSIIAHDLVGPVGMQKNIVDMILSEQEDMEREEIISFLESLQPAINSTNFMIENLLSWAKIAKQNLKPDLKPVMIYTLTKQIFDFLGVQSNEKNVRLTYEGEHSATALTDSHMTEVILRNLVANAIKFSPENGEVKVSVTRFGNRLKIAVIDKGTGMAAEVLHDLRKKSHQARSRPGTHNEKGTGIGLIVVKEFLTKLNTKLQIESKEGEGSTFSFELEVA